MFQSTFIFELFIVMFFCLVIIITGLAALVFSVKNSQKLVDMILLESITTNGLADWED